MMLTALSLAPWHFGNLILLALALHDANGIVNYTIASLKVKVMHLYSTFQMGYALPKVLYM